MSWSRLLAVLVGVFLLSACGFQPLYKKDKTASTIVDDFGGIKIQNVSTTEPADARLGQKLQNRLLDRLNPRGRPRKPAYALETRITVSKEETGVQITEEATRARLTISANFTLTDIAQKNIVLKGSERLVTSYNIVDSEFATLTAEQDAAERAVREISEAIKLRIGTYLISQRQNGQTSENSRR